MNLKERLQGYIIKKQQEIIDDYTETPCTTEDIKIWIEKATNIKNITDDLLYIIKNSEDDK